MLVERIVAVTRNKVDTEELLEKAEIRFLELVGYESSHSDERLTHLMTALADGGRSGGDTTKSLAQIARAYVLSQTGGPLFKCLDAYVAAILTQPQRVFDPAAIDLLFWLEMAGSSFVGPIVMATRDGLMQL